MSKDTRFNGPIGDVLEFGSATSAKASVLASLASSTGTCSLHASSEPSCSVSMGGASSIADIGGDVSIWVGVKVGDDGGSRRVVGEAGPLRARIEELGPFMSVRLRP